MDRKGEPRQTLWHPALNTRQLHAVQMPHLQGITLSFTVAKYFTLQLSTMQTLKYKQCSMPSIKEDLDEARVTHVHIVKFAAIPII